MTPQVPGRVKAPFEGSYTPPRSITGCDLAADDAAPGGADAVTIMVTATAGLIEVTCGNTALTSDSDSPSLSAGDTVDIAARADLNIDKPALSATVSR